jgi:hypothetical protein
MTEAESTALAVREVYSAYYSIRFGQSGHASLDFQRHHGDRVPLAQ